MASIIMDYDINFVIQEFILASMLMIKGLIVELPFPKQKEENFIELVLCSMMDFLKHFIDIV